MKKNLLITFVFFLTGTFTTLFAQQIEVKGTVTDTSGTKLPGVNVIVKGENKGTATDFDGNYQIRTQKGTILVFSYVGFKSREVSVQSNLLHVSLEEDANQLNEVVVTAFGIKKETKTLGYSVQEVKTEDLQLAGQNSAVAALQGRVAGLQISKTSGSAGGGVDILIRGVTSVDPSRNNQPLIIVDGVALNNDTFSNAAGLLPSAGSNAVNGSEQFGFSNRAGDINPEDVESYNVLKGAAATALYGVRASNGAIIITTKRGKKGKAKITISASTTIRNIVTTPDLQKTYREGHRTTTRPGVTIDPNEADGYNDYSWAFYSWGVPYTDDSYEQADGVITDLSKDKFYSPYDLFKTGINRQVNLSVSGADEKIDYYFSLGNNSDSGVLPNTSYDKTSLRFSGGYQLSDKFKVSSSISYTKSGGKRANGGDKSVFSSLSYWSATFPINDYKYEDGTQKNYTPGWIDSPRYFLETSNLKDDVNRWVGNVTTNWKPKEWLSITYSAQVDNYSDRRNRFVPADLDVGTQVGGFIVEENINFIGLESNLLATLTHDFSEDFSATLTVGHQVSDVKTNYAYIRGEGLNIPGVNDLSNTVNIFADSNVKQLRNMGVFGDLRLGYKDKLFLTVTGRNDWLSTLPADNRSFFYPSTSVSYLFHELLGDNKVLSFGKLRASWAQVGKGPSFGNVGRYYYRDPSFPFNGTGGYRSGTREGDLNMVPERSNTFEIGTDLRFFSNRVRLDYSYYQTKVSDQIFKVGAAYSSGLSGVTRNAGDYETWGHEFLITADIVRGEDFKWDATINFSTTAGEVTKLPDDLDEIVFFDDYITAKAREGDALGTLYGWKFQTIDGQRYVNSDGKWVVTGSENSGYYSEAGNQKVQVGNAFPDYVVSLGNNLSYKNVHFNFLVEYKKGGDVYDKGLRNGLRNGNLIETEFRDQTKVLAGVMDDGSGGYTANTTEVLINADNFYRDANNYNAAAEIILQDASWVKLRNIGVSYDFNNKILDKLKITNLSISASANNILVWTPYKGYDPESNYFSAGSNIYGYSGLSVPLSQGFSFGVRVEF